MSSCAPNANERRTIVARRGGSPSSARPGNRRPAGRSRPITNARLRRLHPPFILLIVGSRLRLADGHAARPAPATLASLSTLRRRDASRRARGLHYAIGVLAVPGHG